MFAERLVLSPGVRANLPTAAQAYIAELEARLLASTGGETSGVDVLEAASARRGERRPIALPTELARLQRFARDLGQLLRLATTDYASVDEAIADALATGRAMFEMSTAVLSDVDGHIYRVRAATTSQDFLQVGMEFAVGDTFCELALVRGAAVAIHRASADQRVADRFWRQILEYESYLGAPVTVHGRVVGTLAFATTEVAETNGLAPRQLELMESLAMILGRQIAATERRAEQRRAELTLREREEQVLLAQRGAGDGSWDWDLRTNRVAFSPRWKSMLGWEESDATDQPEAWFRCAHPDDVDRLRGEIDAHLEGQTANLDTEYRILHRDNIYRWVLCRGAALRDDNGDAYRIAGTQTDITDRKVAEEQLLLDAFHDALTGLPNRSQFMDRLRRTIWRARQGRHLFAVLFVDIDRFKMINDSLGHMVGDQLLIAIARRFEGCLRAADVVARLGGDEFVILLDGIATPNDANLVAERLQREVQQPFSLTGLEVFTTASIGITLGSDEYERPEDILRDADTAMYRAKHCGKARHVVFDPTMHERAVELLRLETDLRRAIDRQEFHLHYQPINALDSGRVVGFEALVRWRHPERGLIPPLDFIPVAEEAGLIGRLGDWVLGEACRQMQAWTARFGDLGLIMSVNLSSKQFRQADLVDRIRDIVVASRLDPRRLNLEITESALMDNPDAAAAMLAQLKHLKVGLTIDDFGTGYSSLSYLYRFPLDTLKIDRYFVSRLSERGDETEIVRTIIALGGNLNMRVVAEGIETGEQLEYLRALGCELGQGYLFARPATAESATDLVASLTPRSIKATEAGSLQR